MRWPKLQMQAMAPGTEISEGLDAIIGRRVDGVSIESIYGKYPATLFPERISPSPLQNTEMEY